MLFLTANKPEVLDYAMIRSCRIDNKIKLDYADEYQTKMMFETFLPDQKDKFKELLENLKENDRWIIGHANTYIVRWGKYTLI